MKSGSTTASSLPGGTLKTAVLLSVCAATAFIVLGIVSGPNVIRHYAYMASGASLGVTLGLLVIKPMLAGSLERSTSYRSGIFPILAAGMLLAAISYWCGMRQFGGADQGADVDVAWRLVNGQRPYIDFPCTVPVGFYLGAELAFRLFGVYWRSIVLFNSLCTFIFLIWFSQILRTVFRNSALNFWIPLSCIMGTMVVASFWWYNPITSVAAALYAAAVVSVILAPAHPSRWLSLCLSLYLVALMKPNVGAPLILGGSITLFAFRPTRLLSIPASLIALLLWYLTIRIHGSTVHDVVASYLSVASRGMVMTRLFSGLRWPELTLKVSLLLAALVPWCERCLRRNTGDSAGWPVMLFASFCLLAGLYGCANNSDAPAVHMPPLILAACFIVANPCPDRPLLIFAPKWTRYFTFLCVWLTCFGLGEALVRDRVRNIGDFFEFTEDPSPLPAPFFDGLHSGPIFHSVVRQIADLSAADGLSHAFFGFRLEWAYAAFHVPAPKGLPIWWEPGSTFPAAEETRYEQDWLSRRFNPVLMMDPTFLSPRFCDGIAARYGLRKEEDYHRKGLAPYHELVLRSEPGPPLAQWLPWK